MMDVQFLRSLTLSHLCSYAVEGAARLSDDIRVHPVTSWHV